MKERKNEKEKIYDDLIKLANALDKEEKYKNINHDDLEYFGIRELEKLFGDIDNDDYYKPVLVRSSFQNNYEYQEIRGDRDKKLSIKQYLYTVIPSLADLINNKKKNDRAEWKIQLNMAVNFISTSDTGKMKKLDLVIKQIILLVVF